MERLPKTVDALIDALDRVYPLRNPKVDASMESLQRRAGQRDVVEMLLNLREAEQNESEDRYDL